MTIFQPGNFILNGEFRLEALIGAGAFAEVYHATHIALKASRAIKVLRHDAPGVGSTEFADYAQRFQLEAQLGAQLDSPHVIRVYDFRRDGEMLLLIMEYASGGSLADRIDQARKSGQPIPIDDVIRIALEMTEGLSAIHALDVVHRDLKPSNILFDAQNRAKVGDLGLAQVPGGPSMRSRLSQSVPHPGTPAYMSSEQENTYGHLAPASDIYALGAVLFETLTGRVVKNVRPGTAVNTLRPEVPPWLNDLLARMLADNPRERPWDGAETLEALRAGEAETRRQQEERQREVEKAKREAEDKARLEAEERARIELAKAETRRQQEDRQREVENAKREAEDKARLEAEERARVAQAEAETRRQQEERLREAEEKAKLDAEDKAKRDLEERKRQEAERKTKEEADRRARAGLEAARVAAEKMRLAEAERTHQAEPPSMTEQETTTKSKTSPWLFIIGAIVIVAIIAVLTSNNGSTVKPPTQVAPVVKTSTAAPAQPAGAQSQVSDKDGMTLLYVPAGEFTMGDDNSLGNEPPHIVYLDAFWIDQTEVTNAMYAKCVKAGACQVPSSTKSSTRVSYYGNTQFNTYPVVYVSWQDAKKYCTWAGGDLPTEAQWEKAARGVDQRSYPWGSETPNAARLNYNQNVGDTTEVDKYPNGASPYRALNMAGNVFEWVSDWYGETYYVNAPSRNPTGPISGSERVLRGGSWSFGATWARAALRIRNDPGNQDDETGFRCAR